MNNNEETIIMAEQKPVVNEKEEQKPAKNTTWKKVSIAGVSGIVMGTVATALGAAAATTSEDEPVDLLDVNGTAKVDGEVPVAEVSDDMSFKEAFDAAREQVGPGGVFTWHGHVYNTYSAEEWGSMSAEEHAEFGSHLQIVYDQPVAETLHAAVEPSEEVLTTVIDEEPDYTSHPGQDPVVQATSVEEQPDPEIRILGVEHVTDEDGAEAIIGAFGIEDDVILMADIDMDGNFDVSAYDANHNGTIESDEMLDISGEGFTVEGMAEAYQEQQMQDDLGGSSFAINDEISDYDNNADCMV